ncbi:MAG: hypothetical protein QOG54_2598 [Actinomycetota bacterium]|nr:hypothetical protein [Actinomycetota bacterium]
MRYAVEAWATDYGSSMEAELMELTEGQVDTSVEVPPARWEPISPASDVEPPEKVLFTDGVRRIDARVWIDDGTGKSRPGVCATYAAGVMGCDGRAQLVAATVERGLFSAVLDAEPIVCKHATYEVRRSEGDSPEQLWIAIQKRMAELEATIARGQDAELIVVDGPLRGPGIPNAVGYVKTHHVAYLPPEVNGVVSRLGPGQRTPVFLTLGNWGRFSWYLRLPCAPGHSWAGVVRCETTADRELGEVIALADIVTATLPRFASDPHKDPRAPQNLYPIAGLERDLRRRLGDPAFLYRGLLVAAAGNGAVAS